MAGVRDDPEIQLGLKPPEHGFLARGDGVGAVMLAPDGVQLSRGLRKRFGQPVRRSILRGR